jgi:hypothetical protein
MKTPSFTTPLVVLALVLAAILAGPVPGGSNTANAAVTFYTVSGKITDAGTGQGLNGACVAIAPPGVACQPQFIHADGLGNYTVTLPGGPGFAYTFNFLGCDYRTETRTVNLTQNTTLNVGLTYIGSPKPAPLGGTPTNTVYLPNITKTLGGPGGWVTPFIVQNVDAMLSTNLEVSYYKFSDGCLVTRRIVNSVLPFRSSADIPDNDTDLPNDTQFSVVVRSFGAKVVAVVNEVQGSGRFFEGLSYTATDGTLGANTVYLPNVTRKFYGYDVPFIIQNLGTAQARINVNFVSFDGQITYNLVVIADPAKSTVVDPDYLPAYIGQPNSGLRDQTGYAVTVSSPDQPIAVVANAHDELIGPVAFSYNGLATGAPTLYAPYAAKNADGVGRYSPVIVQNMGAAAVTPTLAFTPLGSVSGTQTQTFSLGSIAPGASKAFDPRFFLNTTTICSGASSTCLGDGVFSLVASAPGGLIAMVVAPSTDAATNATAAAYTASPLPSNRVFLPNVTRTLGGALGYTTPIYLQSGTATAATLKWYRFADGQLAVTQTVPLPVGGGASVDPRTVAGLADDTQYAVVADGVAGTIYGIVFEQAFSGGDAAFIYEGFAQ